MKPYHLLCAALFPTALSAQTIEFGNINVVQNDGGNNSTSVTLTKAYGSSPGFSIRGGNRADFDVSFGTANDVAGGVMLSCVSQLGRDNSAAGDAYGLFYATSASDHVVSGGTAGTYYWVPVFRAAQGDETNINVACTWFSYSQWLGGFARNSAGTNGGVTDTLTASSGINLGTQFTTAGGGVFGLNLGSLGGSSANGVLLVTHGKNEDNYALSKANTDGTFSMYVHDNGANGAAYEQDPIAFVYIPTADVGTKQLVATGRVNSNATSDVAGGTFTVTKGGTGQWYLTIPGHDTTTGVLIVSPEGAGTNTADNIVSYEWDGANSRWIIESRDLSGATALATLQDGATGGEDMFSFAFFATPNNAPDVSITGPALDEFTTPGSYDVEASATDIDGTIQLVEFLRNGEVIGTDDTAPYVISETGLPAGKYSYAARATDNYGTVSTSAAKEVAVTLDSGNIPANTALWFDGVNDFVTMGTALDLGAGGPPNNGMTLECWFRKEGTGATASSGSGGVSVVPLFAKGRGESDGSNVDCNYIFGIDADGHLTADFEDLATGLNHPVIGTNTPIENHVWHHAAVTYDGNAGTWTIYLDGAPVGSGSAPASTLPRYDSIQHFGIGTAMTSTGVTQGAFAGVIDEVRVWNYARSLSEIGDSKNYEITTEAGLIGRYGLNEGGGLATSSTTGSSGGTITNGPLWVDGAPFATAPNLTPTVAVTSPVDGASVFAAAPVTITAAASDADGSIDKVEFRVDGVVIGEDTTAPYSFEWTPLTVGSYSLSASVTDNLGAIGFSAGRSVTAVFDPLTIPSNTALLFDGVNDYVTMGTAPELNVGGPPTSAFTLECWFRKEGTGLTAGSGSGGVTAVPLFGKGRGESDGSNVDCNIFFGITTGGILVADFESQSSGLNHPITATNAPIGNGTWHHAAVTFDGTVGLWTLYLDGAAVGTSTVSVSGAVPRFDSIQHFGIGTALNSTGVRDGAFNGVIDEARVWNYARSAVEIAASMDLEIGTMSGLIGRFGLNEGSGLITSSTSGTSVGNLINGPVWVEGFPTTTTNASPVVALTAPLDNAVSLMPYPVSFTANASDADSGIAKVEFLVNGTVVGEDSTDPYGFDWTPPSVGTYAVSARAVDTLGAGKLSGSNNLIIDPNPNQAPVVTLVNPADGATVSGSTVTLEANLNDPEGDALTVTFYGRNAQPTTPGPDFTVVAIPDTQYYSEGNPTKAANWGLTVEQVVGQFSAQTQWVVDNSETRNVAFVAHMGDIVENGNFGGNPIQWERASAAMGLLEDPLTTLRANGIPYGLAPGNHDIDPIGSYDTGSTAFYNQYFGTDRFAGRAYWGGNYGSDNTNNYQLWSASGLDFVTIHLSYDTTPNQEILDWADAVLKAYPDRRAIVTSHYIIGQGNPASFSTQGSAIYQNLKDNPNLFLLLCGHIHAEGFRSDTFEGRTVYSVLSDYQGLVNGGNAFLRTLTFSPANNRLRVESWSPTLGRAASASEGLPHFDGAYDLTYDMQAPVSGWTELGTVEVPAAGTTASLQWNGLEASRGYEWYAAATDSINVASSASRSFNTDAGTPPLVTLDAPLDGATYSSPATIPLSATASDDGSVVRVEFLNGGTKIGEDDTAPYEYAWSGVQPGSYVLTARALDDQGLATVSNVANVTVEFGDGPPTVALVAPTTGTLLEAPASVTLAADANDVEAPVAKVEFLSGQVNPTVLGEDLEAPFTLDLTGLAPGTYNFSARATDSVGQTATSTLVTMTVFTEAAVPDATTVSVGTFDAPSWTVVQTGPSPLLFDAPGTNLGDLELRINGSSVVFNDGITMASNWNGPTTGAAAQDNLCQPYYIGANAFVNVYDNTNNNAPGANPGTAEETAGLSVAYLPYAKGWTGASVLSDASILAGNLPGGVTVSGVSGGVYGINGLSTAGNLFAFTNGNSGTLADNVCSVRVVSNRWLIDTRDNAGGLQANDFSFVYLPPATTGVFAGHIAAGGTVSNLNIAASALGVTAVPGVDGVDITFGDGSIINPATAALFVTADSTNGGSSSVAVDNLISWSANGNSFRVFTQDLEGVNGTNEAIDLRVLAIPFTPVVLPEVSIAATDAAAGEHGADQALAFTVTRSGSTVAELGVPLVASGSATAGTDYTGFQSTLTIPVGQSSATLPLTVQPDGEAEGAETVTIALGASAEFSAGTPASADGTIEDKPDQGFYFANIADPAKRAPTDDADGDATANIIEYYMGTLPGDANSRATLVIPTASGNSFKVRYQRAKNRPDVTGALRWSTDLAQWSASGQDNGGVTVTFAESVVSESGADPEIIEASGTVGGAGQATKIFVRLGVE